MFTYMCFHGSFDSLNIHLITLLKIVYLSFESHDKPFQIELVLHYQLMPHIVPFNIFLCLSTSIIYLHSLV